MIFIGTPNHKIYTMVKQGFNQKRVLVGSFDIKGEFETHDLNIIAKMKNIFKIKEEKAEIKEEKPKTEKKPKKG